LFIHLAPVSSVDGILSHSRSYVHDRKCFVVVDVAVCVCCLMKKKKLKNTFTSVGVHLGNDHRQIKFAHHKEVHYVLTS
jgi:hypothetical protein